MAHEELARRVYHLWCNAVWEEQDILERVFLVLTNSKKSIFQYGEAVCHDAFSEAVSTFRCSPTEENIETLKAAAGEYSRASSLLHKEN